MKKQQKRIGLILLLVAIFFFGWESSRYYFNHTIYKDDNNQGTPPIFSTLLGTEHSKADLTTFWEVWGLLENMYVDETVVQKQNMVYGAIQGMVASLGDPYTVYMTPEETIEFDQNLGGKLDGIGAELTVREHALIVVTPLKGSPAEQAGLLPGDIIYKIDGELAGEMSLFEAIMNIRGERGTQVILTIVREGMEDAFDVPIIRETIQVDSVELEPLDDNIYHLSVYQFTDNTQAELEPLINELIVAEAKGLILDLRNNGGGYLEISVDILSEFLSGRVDAVSIQQRDEQQNEELATSGNPRLANIPMVVLINNGSASAAEIVAGALQDYDRAIIMGETSFGKGSVQEVDKLRDGSSIRFTIARWFTPNGNNIDHVGIEPDIEVPMTDEDYLNDQDPQLEAAIDYLGNL